MTSLQCTVCGRPLRSEEIFREVLYFSQFYYVCSAHCLTTLNDEPQTYIKSDTKELPTSENALLEHLDPTLLKQYGNTCPYQIVIPSYKERYCAASEYRCNFQEAKYTGIDRYICNTTLTKNLLLGEFLTPNQVNQIRIKMSREKLNEKMRPSP